jgi:meso-butanediol dehydrogenase / (S,S)-butanediol dehydrogenase / diacetyl reductase
MAAPIKNLSRGEVAGRLKGKVALVTGAGSGQGREVALLFARAGAQVSGSDTNAAALRSLCEEASAAGHPLDVFEVDASDRRATGAWIDAVAQRHGGVDVLYNNAARTYFAPFEEMTLDQWRDTLRLELDVVFIPSQAAWRHMVARGGGSIINIASVSGMRGSELIGAAAHAAGKSGVIGFSRQLALEGAPHWIRCNSLSPGPIVTPVTEPLIESNPAFAKAFETWPLLHRSGRPIDVAFAGLFLASDESAFITGTNLVVDGGFSCKGGFRIDETNTVRKG